MRAVVCTRYGPPDVLAVRERPDPVPGAGEVVIAVRAAGINAADRRLMRADPAFIRPAIGWRGPRDPYPGCEVAGTVAARGPGADRFRTGDPVMADVLTCGRGAFADLVRVPEQLVAAAPLSVSPYEAATLPLAGGTALQALRDRAGLRAGEHVLVQGASGAVGTLAVQVARILGARVTAACRPAHAARARALGADEVVDSGEDVAADGRRYDVILGVNGHQPLRRYRAALRRGGRYLMVGGTSRQLVDGLLAARILSSRDRRLGSFALTAGAELLETLARWVDEGRLTTVVDRTFALDDVVAAFRHVERGPAVGRCVLTTGPVDVEPARTGAGRGTR